MEIQAVFAGQRGCGRMDEASSRRRRSVGRLCDTRWTMRSVVWAKSKTRWCDLIGKRGTDAGLDRVRSELIGRAGMAELADAADSKSAGLRPVGVRPPLPAPKISHLNRID